MKKKRFVVESQREYYLYDRLLKVYITDGGGTQVCMDKDFAEELATQLTKWDLPQLKFTHPEYGKCILDLEAGLEGTTGTFYSLQEEQFEYIDLMGTPLESLIPLLNSAPRAHWDIDPPETL